MTIQPPLLTTLSEAQQAQAIERFVILRPALEEGVPQTQIARTYDLPLSTVQRWIKRYRERGLVGLARQQRSDRGMPRGIPSKLVQLIEGLALQTPLRSVVAIHNQVTEVAKQKGWKPPSYSRVYQIVRFARESYDTLEPLTGPLEPPAQELRKVIIMKSIPAQSNNCKEIASFNYENDNNRAIFLDTY